MENCAYCGKIGTIGFGEYYRIDSTYSDRHELLVWCSKECFEKAHAKAEKLQRFGKHHSRHGDSMACLGEFYLRELPLGMFK